MDKKRKRRILWDRIRSRQFQVLFLKNWLLVFLCIVIPLVLGVSLVRYVSEKSLLQEMNTSAKRGTGNTAVTVNTLFEEACTALEKEAVDEDILSFFQMEYELPVRYEFIHTVRSVLDRINEDYRENLYDSMDVYSETGDYVLSSMFKGQSFDRFIDKSLVETFQDLAAEHPNQNLFAASRVSTKAVGSIEKKVITIYRKRTINHGHRAFVSISIDTEKLTEYITDNLDGLNGAYLIVDNDYKVIMDTSKQLDYLAFDVLKETELSSMEVKINGEKMWLTWIPMDYFDWKFVQIVPMEEVHQNNIKLNRLVMVVVLVGMIIASVISYYVTSKLYYPIEAILQLIENPSEKEQFEDEKGEVGYLLVSILELFQRNIILEKEMVERVVTLRRARAKALQEQMTPHFLNNVLQTINWSAIQETGSENSVTSRSLLLLADIIRMGKEKTTNLTTVAGEIEYTKKFVELECLRYGDGIQCHYQIDESAKQLPIPCISLQTLVENAISHGLQPKHGIGNIYISILSIGRTGLQICVEDDGIGIEEQKIQQIFETLGNEYIYVGEHLGLINLFQRFRLIYGDSCQFSIDKSQFGGASIIINLPDLPDWWNTLQ